MGINSDRVARGAMMLDWVMPGWVERINTERLDMKDGNWCILGQLYRDRGGCCGWCNATTPQDDGGELFGEDDRDEHGVTPTGYGFTEPYGRRWDALTEYWRREVNARR